MLVSGSSMGEAVWPIADSSMDLLPAGPLPPNPAALLGPEALTEFDREARARYELVVYDTPPLSVAADASLIASVVEGVVLVVDARRTERRLAEQAIDQLRRAQVTILGVVVNRVDPGPYTSGYYAAVPADDGRDEVAERALERPRSRD